LGPGVLEDHFYHDGNVCAFVNQHMAITGENVAERYNISRQAQDEFALLSQERAARAEAAGIFKEEIVPVPIKTKKETTLFERDEFIRPNTTLEKLAALPPVFKKDGTVTAGNACGLSDGAAAAVLMSREEADRRGIKPLGIFRACFSAGVEPEVMGMGPVPAIRKLLQATGLSLNDIGVIEINEAFAAQVLACRNELGIDMNKLNVNGGAIALGHPTGMSGCRLVLTVLREMRRRGVKYGIASLCAGGGPGIAALLENID
jgi:acetyl-CoA C-acetyltransferase